MIQPTAAQLITRKYNFRKGDSARLRQNIKSFDNDLRKIMSEAIDTQQDREEVIYKGRMAAIRSGDPMRVRDFDYDLALALQIGRKPNGV